MNTSEIREYNFIYKAWGYSEPVCPQRIELMLENKLPFLIDFQHFTVLVYHVFPENGSLSYLSEWDSYIKFTIREYMEGTFFMKSAAYVHCNTTIQYPFSLGGNLRRFVVGFPQTYILLPRGWPGWTMKRFGFRPIIMKSFRLRCTISKLFPFREKKVYHIYNKEKKKQEQLIFVKSLFSRFIYII